MSPSPLLLVLVALGAADDDLTTVVAGRADDDGGQYVGGAPAAATPHAEDALEDVPGVVLVRSGGPLAPARLDVRGLSGPRVAVSADGLALTDPLDGALDAAMLPLFFADTVHGATASGTFAGVALASRPVDVDLVTLSLLAGTLDTIDVRATAALASADDDAHARVGVRAARTTGDFRFTPTSALGPLGPPRRRDGNDQARVVAMARADAAIVPGADVEAAALVAAHEGGVPGFATSPTDGLRAQSTLAAAGVTARASTGLADGRVVVELSPAARHTARATRDDGGELGRVATDEHGLALAAHVDDVVPAVAARVGARVARAAIRDTTLTRRTTTGTAAVTVGLFADQLRLAADVELGAVSDVGLLASGGATLLVGPDWLHARLTIARRARPPTLDELYAPRGLVVGNPDLAPETLTEAEVAAHFVGSRIVTLDATLFGGVLEDAILYVNRSAYVIAPVNTGPAARAGAELALAVRPHRFLGGRAVARATASHVVATGAPLPVTPPFAAHEELRLGPASGPHVVAVARHRAGTTANLFGTVAVAPYSLVDVIASWPLAPGCAVRGALTNVFDVTTAQDANLLPLPGRQLYVSLEVTR